MRNYPTITLKKEDALEISDFQKMDYYAVKEYLLPIELLMENAGLHLAHFIIQEIPPENDSIQIQIGVGPGNNGGGGLVAARRLAAWGYSVSIDFFSEHQGELAAKQLDRALKNGVNIQMVDNPTVYVDAYLGFSQRAPLPAILIDKIKKANELDTIRISLDIPTGLFDFDTSTFFKPHSILTLAAPKRVLFNENIYNIPVFIADLGISKDVYQNFKMEYSIPFEKSSIVELIKTSSSI